MKEHLPLPELEGTHGKAWRIILYKEGESAPPKQAIVDWLVEVPEAHPFWHSYWLALFQLADLDGAVIYLPGATHELVVHALDPMIPRRIHGIPKHLEPPNFCAQIISESDFDAEARITESVREMINGTLNPDTDFMQQWIERYGDNMVKK